MRLVPIYNIIIACSLHYNSEILPTSELETIECQSAQTILLQRNFQNFLLLTFFKYNIQNIHQNTKIISRIHDISVWVIAPIFFGTIIYQHIIQENIQYSFENNRKTETVINIYIDIYKTCSFKQFIMRAFKLSCSPNLQSIAHLQTELW